MSTQTMQERKTGVEGLLEAINWRRGYCRHCKVSTFGTCSDCGEDPIPWREAIEDDSVLASLGMSQSAKEELDRYASGCLTTVLGPFDITLPNWAVRACQQATDKESFRYPFAYQRVGHNWMEATNGKILVRCEDLDPTGLKPWQTVGVQWEKIPGKSATEVRITAVEGQENLLVQTSPRMFACLASVQRDESKWPRTQEILSDQRRGSIDSIGLGKAAVVPLANIAKDLDGDWIFRFGPDRDSAVFAEYRSGPDSSISGKLTLVWMPLRF